ncbi:MAG TPA: hypothetical protein VF669_22015 [Tepidisphaeraceae bacterium]|jgi:hypothetical protein
MPFDSGSITFRRFAVIGNKQPKTFDQDHIDLLANFAIKEKDIQTTPEEVEYGWSAGRHILDADFSFDNNVFADCLHFALRIDTNKFPGELRKAYQLMEEDAAARKNPSGFISKMQKRDAKDVVSRKIEDELRAGHFRRSKLVSLLWDSSTSTVLSPATGKSFEYLAELFERTFDLTLQPLSSGSLALRILEPKGKRRDYEDVKPTRFVPSQQSEAEYPEYPWVLKGPEPKDFLGNEFLLWLWSESEGKHAGAIQTEAVGEITLMIDRSLDLDCAYGQSGKDSLKGTAPSKFPEARDALRTGKLPRKAGMLLDVHNQQYAFTFNPESFTLNSTKLPDVEEAETPRVLFEERITLLRDLCQSMDALFETFLKVRASSAWESQTGNIRRWIHQAPKQALTAVA